MPCECDIIFKSSNNLNDIFYSGQEVCGTAIILTRKLKSIKGIHIIIKGYAKVNWHQGQFKIFSDERNYIGTQTYLRGEEGSKPFLLLPRLHEYNFQLHLPENLPSSIKTEFGRIHYEVILTVVNPWTLNNVFKKSFTVQYPMDLNSDPIYQKPIDHIAKCRSWWNFCGPQILRLQFKTKTSGFEIGKPLKFILIVENDTNFNCCDIQIKLKKIQRYSVDLKGLDDMTIRTAIFEKSLGSLSKSTVKEFDGVLEVPQTEPSSLDTCDILYTSYRIQIIVKTPWLHDDLITIVPIFLGTVPIGGNLVDVVKVIDTYL